MFTKKQINAINKVWKIKTKSFYTPLGWYRCGNYHYVDNNYLAVRYTDDCPDVPHWKERDGSTAVHALFEECVKRVENKQRSKLHSSEYVYDIPSLPELQTIKKDARAIFEQHDFVKPTLYLYTPEDDYPKPNQGIIPIANISYLTTILSAMGKEYKAYYFGETEPIYFISLEDNCQPNIEGIVMPVRKSKAVRTVDVICGRNLIYTHYGTYDRDGNLYQAAS